MKKSELRRLIREAISEEYKVGKRIDPAYIRAGDIVYVSYKSNPPWLSKFIGFSNHKQKYGEGGAKFGSSADAMKLFSAAKA